MPCYRCGARQVDPARGPSPWKRAVQAGSQVLICPGCQYGRDWTAELDRCPSCDSTALYRTLGETSCRACGGAVAGELPPAGAPEPAGTSASGALADDVAAALARVLRGGVH